MYKPEWVFHLWCLGAADRYLADDSELPVSLPRRLLWRVRGWVLQAAFGWWRWVG